MILVWFLMLLTLDVTYIFNVLAIYLMHMICVY